MKNNKGSVDALILIVCLPCVAFVLAITLLGIVKPVMGALGSTFYHAGNSSAPFQLIPLKPTPTPASQKPRSSIALPHQLLPTNVLVGQTTGVAPQDYHDRASSYLLHIE